MTKSNEDRLAEAAREASSMLRVIARALGVTQGAVASSITAVRRKLGVHSAAQAVAKYAARS